MSMRRTPGALASFISTPKIYHKLGLVRLQALRVVPSA